MNAAMILAGGVGSRIGADVPKQFIPVLGKPVLAYTLEIFQNNPNIDAIEIVCHKDWIEEVRKIVGVFHFDKVKWLCTGGETFQASVMRGVENLKGKLADEDIAVISFGVSPMTTDEVIDDSIRVAKKNGNGISSEDISLCTCLKEDEESSLSPVLRETLKGFGNPWAFRFGELCEAYETGKERGLLDTLEPHTTSLYLALGKRIYFSRGSHTICKLTYKEDLDLFEGWLLLKAYREGKVRFEDAQGGLHGQLQRV